MDYARALWYLANNNNWLEYIYCCNEGTKFKTQRGINHILKF